MLREISTCNIVIRSSALSPDGKLMAVSGTLPDKENGTPLHGHLTAC